MAQQVAAVRRDLDIENRVRWKKITDRRANFCIWRQNQQARSIFAQAELDWTAKHSFAFNATQFTFSNFSSVRQLCSGQRKRNFVADFVIGRPANDLAFRSTAIITSQTVRRSAFGWREEAAICETITSSTFALRVSMFSVSTPARVSNSAISSRFFGRSTNSRSQLTENFMRTGGESANRFARKGECQGYRTRSSLGDPCPDRTHNQSTFRGRRHYRPASC